MQTDEEIGKVAAAVPIIISRSLEIFLQSLVETTASYTTERKAKTMTTAHLKHCIEGERKFDFLKDLVANIADISTQEEEEGTGEHVDKPKRQRKPRATGGIGGERRKRKKESSSDEDSDTPSDTDEKSSAPVTQQSILPPVIPPITSSLPTPAQQNRHSIDAIMGNTPLGSNHSSNQPPVQLPTTSQQEMQKPMQPITFQPVPPTNMQPSFGGFQGNFPSFQQAPTMPMQMNMPESTNEDDDYDA